MSQRRRHRTAAPPVRAQGLEIVARLGRHLAKRHGHRQQHDEHAKQGIHDYSREEGDSVRLDGEERKEIDSLLSRRMECKMRRDFAKADALQEELRSMHGVEVNDRFRTWRVL